MKNRKWTMMLAALIVASASALSYADGPQWSTRMTEGQCIEILKKADADPNDKFAACRQLAVVGKADAIPVLAALLVDEKLSHMARYGLEPNPDPAVDAAFRDALGKTKGRMLAGVITSIGFRKDAKAVEALGKLLCDADPVVASAAAVSLGEIATPEAASALKQAANAASAQVRPGIEQGLLRIADARLDACKADEALALYDMLASSSMRQIRIAAARGSVLASGSAAGEKIVAMLQGTDGDRFAVAQRLAIELPGVNITHCLMTATSSLKGDGLIAAIVSLGHRGDIAAVPTVIIAAQKGEKATRIAALQALTELGERSALSAMIPAATDADADVAKTAQTALAAFPGKHIDAALLPLLDSPDGAVQRVGIDVLAARRAPEALAKFVVLIKSADADTRTAAVKAVGDMGGCAEVQPVLDVLLQAKSPESATAEAALSAIFSRATNPDAYAEPVIVAQPKAPAEAKPALLRVLSAGGGAKALAAVKASMNDADPAVADAALLALCNWPNEQAVDDLLKVIESSSNPAHVTLAVRGCARLAKSPDASVADRLALSGKAIAAARRVEDKKIVLSAMSAIVAPASLDAVLTYLADEKLREDAGQTAIILCEKLIRGNPESVAPAMAKVKECVKGKGLKARAAALYDRAAAAKAQ